MEPTDIREKQMGSQEQKAVLDALAVAAAGQGSTFLEIGSWCGESSAVLGKVAKNKNGRLFCIDWWKGNTGMELEQIAKRSDIFSVFWENMKKEGLEDVVIPIRARSDMVSDILQKESFDLIYIDGDHRHDAALNDIKRYAPLLKVGGIICGDDCEGYVSDYDRSFLEEGKSVDCHESVHCGVVLAVGEYFHDYLINYNTWSVKKTADGWKQPDVSFGSFRTKRQYQPPAIEAYKYYNLMRYGRLIYAVPQDMDSFDVTEEAGRSNPSVITAATVTGIKDLIDLSDRGKIFARPSLIEEDYEGYNIVAYGARRYAIHCSLGDIDLTTTDMSLYQQSEKCFIMDTIEEVKREVEKFWERYEDSAGVYDKPHLIMENYKGYNIVAFGTKRYAILCSLGSLDIASEDLSRYIKRSKCFIADSITVLKSAVDQYANKSPFARLRRFSL